MAQTILNACCLGHHRFYPCFLAVLGLAAVVNAHKGTGHLHSGGSCLRNHTGCFNQKGSLLVFGSAQRKMKTV